MESGKGSGAFLTQPSQEFGIRDSQPMLSGRRIISMWSCLKMLKGWRANSRNVSLQALTLWGIYQSFSSIRTAPGKSVPLILLISSTSNLLKFPTESGNLPTPAGDKLGSTTAFNCPMEPGILVNDSHWFNDKQLLSTRAPIESGTSVIEMEIQNQVQEISRFADRCRNLSKWFTFPSTKNFNLLHISTNGNLPQVHLMLSKNPTVEAAARGFYGF